MEDNFNCSTKLFKVDLVYDCRYSLSLQQRFLTLFLQKFHPLKWILNYTRARDGETDFSVNQMTYTSSKLFTFQRLTQRNFTLDNFKAATSNLKKFSCPKYLSLDTVFDDTKDEIINDTDIVRKFAIFVLAENITFSEDDEAVVTRLDSEQTLYKEVKRLFILIKQPVRGTYFFSYTNTLNEPAAFIRRSIWFICEICRMMFSILPHYNSCYQVDFNTYLMTAAEAEKTCEQAWPGSHLAHINSQNELDFLVLYQNLIRQFVLLQRISMMDGNGNVYAKNLDQFVNGLKKISLVTFIGLSNTRVNSHDDYTWNDGTPLVIDPPWGSRDEGKGCFYITLNYTSPGVTPKLEHYEWNEQDCKERRNISFILCESERIEEDKLFIGVNTFNNKNQSKLTLIYESYWNILHHQMNTQVGNKEMKHFIQNINLTLVEHKCDIDCKKEQENRELFKLTRGHFRELITRSHPASEIYLHNDISPLLNAGDHISRGKKTTITNFTTSNTLQIEVSYLQQANRTVSKCLYEKDFKTHSFVHQNNSYLVGCETFVCPQGYVKCPNSYCISAYFVHDDKKDCPHSEDEISFDEITICTRKFRFTLRNICLNQDAQRKIRSEKGNNLNSSTEFVCQVPCDPDYNCLSNVVRTQMSNNTSLYSSYLETTVRLYKELDVFKFTPQVYSLFIFNKLIDVDLRSCKINDLNNVIKSLDSLDIKFLDVSSNEIVESTTLSVIEGMKDLQYLNLSFNIDLELDENFTFPSNIQVLDLSYTKCGNRVIQNIFVHLINLKILVLSHLKPIDFSRTGNVLIQILDIRGTKVVNMKYGYLSWLGIQNALYADDYRICCELIRGPNIPAEKCFAPRDAISTCQDLIGNPLKRNILWFVGVLSLIGNTSVVVYRLFWERGVIKKAYGLYVVYLGISDFIMGVYLLIIAGADMLYRNKYVLADAGWRNSYICKLAGILSIFSSETSTIFICLITLDRFLVIRYAFGEHRISKVGKIVSICLTTIICTTVSIIPALFPDWEIYSYNGMCLALPFSSGSYTGWEFSVVVFIGINFILFLLIAIGQVAIFLALSSYKNNLSNVKTDETRRAQERAIARQLFLVAMSDFCCWFPIGIMGIMSLRGFEFNLEVYAWTAVVILPVNSAINPLIYTLPAIWKRFKQQ